MPNLYLEPIQISMCIKDDVKIRINHSACNTATILKRIAKK